MPNPPTWKDIFSQKDKFADTTEIAIGDTKLTLGELRQLDAEQQGAVAKELQKATEMQRKLEQDQITVANLYAELSNQKTPAPAPPNQPAPDPNAIDYSSDPILRPLAKQINDQVAEIKALKESLTGELGGLKKQLQTAAASYINDSWRSQFDNLQATADEVEKPILSKVTLQDALRYADQNKIRDARDVPDPIQAAYRMTEKDRLAAIRKHEREQGKQEGIDLGRKQAKAEAPRPGVMGRRVEQPKYKNMDEAMAHIGEDEQIAEQLNALHRPN